VTASPPRHHPRPAARRPRRDGERGSFSLPELLTVTVTSLVVLAAILLSLLIVDQVTGRTNSRSDDLRATNVALEQLSRDVRAAYAVAPPDPASPAAGDGVSLLVQQGTTTGARDPRVWVTYRCTAAAGTRTCTRTVTAAEAACPTCESTATLPAMLMSGGRFATSAGTPIAQSVLVQGLVDDGQPVFRFGWPVTTACSGDACTTWARPTTGDARLDARGIYVRGTGDLRPPAVGVRLRVRSGKNPAPVATTTTLLPRGCVDPSAPSTTGDQFEC
jgi:hypothetical protein